MGIVAAKFMWEQRVAVAVAQPTSCERTILRCARVANACKNGANELTALSIEIYIAIVLLKGSHCASVINFYAANGHTVGRQLFKLFTECRNKFY